jgi:hypothetical protein
MIGSHLSMYCLKNILIIQHVMLGLVPYSVTKTIIWMTFKNKRRKYLDPRTIKKLQCYQGQSQEKWIKVKEKQ